MGFWYDRKAAADACQKAFVTNRVGDFGLLLGLLGLYWATGTFEFGEAGAKLHELVESGALSTGLATLFCVLLFMGPAAKSAQFPLHVWLPDAMEGPTPISALIHAATMVAAGVFLIARLFPSHDINEDLQVGLAAANSVFTLMDEVPEADQGQQEMRRAQGKIEFRGVGLQYESAKAKALNDLSFTIKPGEKLALVGRSGGGKTSMVNLIPRFYEHQQGEIFLDGVNTRELSLSSLRAQFALVSQDVVLFNDTVFNNIAYGALRNVTEQQVVDAAKAANAWEFIQHLPNGLQTEIGDRGVRLSGGQRQRLAIARAILKDAPILLLDEATSALDSITEKEITDTLKEISEQKNRINVMIAHRLSTIMHADCIYVLEKGRVIEQGNHEELLDSKGLYYAMWRQQIGESDSFES